ncbi:hypothetical protein J437_LFUL007493 [Ladona fulva]|uniref:Uncharacterized protein n=1 Tax=Ladona fulva TaxID=123851 RepID=A0A8K0P5S6_LADFU|nr:hypothetical protein J437_LFUL007493 [Ladona fulva]
MDTTDDFHSISSRKITKQKIATMIPIFFLFGRAIEVFGAPDKRVDNAECAWIRRNGRNMTDAIKSLCEYKKVKKSGLLSRHMTR